jgi:hypothetical protein
MQQKSISLFASFEIDCAHLEIARRHRYRLMLFRNSKFQNTNWILLKISLFRTGSREHWTLLYMTISTLHTFRYNSVIDSFAPIASSGTILELALSEIQNFKT